MGSALGARVHLDRVPLKYDGLRYDEIWISEAQERMVLAVPPENVAAVIELCAWPRTSRPRTSVQFSADGRLVLDYDGQAVGELNMDFLHNGLPARSREATWQPAEPEEPVDSGALASRLGRRRSGSARDGSPSPTSPPRSGSFGSTTTRCRAAA